LLILLLSITGAELKAAQLKDALLFTQKVEVKKGGQELDVLDKVINLDLQGITLEEGLHIIADKVDLTLVYSPKVVPCEKPVSLSEKNIKVEDALWAILDGTGLRFGVSSKNHLVLLKSAEARGAESPAFAAR